MERAPSHWRRRGVRRLALLAGAVVMAGVAGCDNGGDRSATVPGAPTAPSASTSSSTDGSRSTSGSTGGRGTTDAGAGSADHDASTAPGTVTSAGAKPATGGTTPPTTAALTTPTAIEDALLDPASAWPAGLPAPGGTRRAFADGTDNQLLAAIFQPVLPAVPQASAVAVGGPYVVRVESFEFPTAAATEQWIGSFAGYQADETANLPGAVHVERHPLAEPPPGWSGYVVDALYKRSAATQWQRTATLVRGGGVRAYRVSVRWFGDAQGGVPDLGPVVPGLARAQDALLAARRIGGATPGTGAVGGFARLALVERAAPWATLLGQPDITVAAGSQALVADAPDAIPSGARPDGAVGVASRVACGERGCPLFSVVTKLPDAAAAQAASQRWSSPAAGLGPLDEIAFPAGATFTNVSLVDASAVPAASALTATATVGTTNYQVGAAWTARADSVYGVFAVYPSASANAQVVTAVLKAQSERLAALGLPPPPAGG